MSGLSSEVAEWAIGFSLDAAPQGVVHNTRLRILDLVGVMIASGRLEAVDAARRASGDADAGGRGAHSLVDAAETSPASAAFINGVASAVLEFDDTHIATNIHPTGVLPVGRASRRAGGAAVREAIDRGRARGIRDCLPAGTRLAGADA